MLYEIKHRYSGAVLFSLECGSLKLCVETAISARADLTGAYLAQADLTGAYLTGADLTGAYLAQADLTRADLTGANLAQADLTGADLTGAYLARADLTGADLTGANLARADLTGADLTGAIYIDGGSDRRSYYFRVLRAASGTLEIRAGCRLWNNFADALAHYDDRYASDGDRAECIARLTLMRDELARRMEQEPPK